MVDIWTRKKIIECWREYAQNLWLSSCLYVILFTKRIIITCLTSVVWGMPGKHHHLCICSINSAYQASLGCSKSSLTRKECRHWAAGFHVDLVLDCYSQHPQVTRGLPLADPGTEGILPCYSVTNNNKGTSAFTCSKQVDYNTVLQPRQPQY